ncbi:hypothetical protein EGW08_018850 [Elysia chlorotica]|uniref:G-protein coupled receptors family 1 profile domain-containing protein n=1 Tax=Elysia chlorotica TaxID=188477 RepID=A0A3S1B6P4_ELYCH|nr:hypothetical protein EGW08_018850 [Elysia chlorotica]
MLNLSDFNQGVNVSAELLSMELRNVLLSVNSIILLLLGISGILTNILNMLTFHKMGLGQGTNTSFFALSAADLVCECIFVIMAVITMGQAHLVELAVDLTHLRYILGPVIVSISAYISWVTAIINVERCFCVLLPQRAKYVFSVKTTTSLILGMLAVQLSIITTRLFSEELTTLRSPHVTLTQSSLDSSKYVAVTFWGASLPSFICFLVTVASTMFLVNALTKRQKWLQSLPTADINTVKKNKTLMYMVVVISLVHIICFLPSVLIISLSLATKHLNPFKPGSRNLYFVLTSFAGSFQAFSSVVNLFIYLKMSSNYNKCLRSLLHNLNE